jgi:lipopolysaccharide export system protein LptA
MTHHPDSFLTPRRLCWLLALCASAAMAEKADRGKPMTMESDRPCTVDLVKQVSVCSGNVVIAQGTLLIRAERIELRESADGYRVATAIGGAGKPAQYRQKRDGLNEYVEGSADRLEYDGRADTMRFTGNAVVRRLRDGSTGDEIQGSVILWDNTAELFSVQGGAPNAANPGGRVRAVLAPPPSAVAPAPAPASGAGLRASPALGERR